ncbi:MAG: flavodoxin domain-containing protein [Clostridia bacterium]|nr:flavodoxin domain-containing protein [Clostridia bacterium]
MKKVLIAYASKSGTVKACAERLARHLEGHEVVLCDLEQSMPSDISEYDFVAVGSPIRMSKLHKRVASFIDKFDPALAKARVGYFICCGFTDSAEEYMTKNLPAELRERAITCACFGGELNARAQRGWFDKYIMRAMISTVLDDGAHDGEMRTANLPSVDPESISRFAGAIKESFGKRK